MTLKHLKVFVAVCRENSITKAAEALYIAQPSVSVTISEIEKYYGVRLFERINKRLVITAAGKALYGQACLTLKSFEQFEETALQSKAAVNLRIGTSLTIGKYMGPKIVTNIKRQYPDINLNVVINQTKKLEDMILQGELDFALVEGTVCSDAIIGEVFATDCLIATAGINYPADVIKTDGMNGHKFILREKGSASRDYFDYFLNERNIIIEPYIESISTQAIIACLIEGLGISILPYNLVKGELQNNRLKQIGIEGAHFERSYYVIRHKNKILSAPQQAVFNMCCYERFHN